MIEWTKRLGEGGGERVWGVWADGGNMVTSKLVKQYGMYIRTEKN